MTWFTKRSLVRLPLTALYLLACSRQDFEQPEGEPIPPRDYEAPELCELARTARPVCAFQGLPPADDSMVGAGGMGGMGGAGTLDEDEEEGEEEERQSRCLVDQDITLSCPSRVGMLATARGAQDEFDVVVAQRGTDALNEHATLLPNDRAYVHTLRLHEEEQLSVGANLFEPFPAETGSLALLPATPQFDTLLVTHQQPSESPPGTLTILPLLGGAPVMSTSIATPLLHPPRSFVTSQAEGIFVEFAPLTGIFVTSGLPNSPVTVSRTERADAIAVAATSSGELRVVVHEQSEIPDRPELRLLGGAALDQELWSFEGIRGGLSAAVDLVHLPGKDGDTAAVLWRSVDSDRFRVTLVGPDGTIGAPAILGNHSDNCSSLSIGLTCSNCPEGDRCSIREDRTHTARLFESVGRLFVAYLATDRTEHREYRRNTASVGGINLGCTCTNSRVDSEASTDVLVVVEIELTIDDYLRPAVIEHMREPVAEAGATQNSFMTRGPQGTLDVVFGPFFGRFSDGQREFPESPIEYRVLRVAPRIAP